MNHLILTKVWTGQSHINLNLLNFYEHWRPIPLLCLISYFQNVTGIGNFWHHGKDQKLLSQLPTKFIVGDKDIGFESIGTREYVTGDVFQRFVPNLKVFIIDGVCLFRPP